MPKSISSVALVVLSFCLSSCGPAKYHTPYGTYYSEADAACAHLYQEQAKKELKDNWENELNQCFLAYSQSKSHTHASQKSAYWGSVAGGIADIYRPDPVTSCTPAAGGAMRCVHSDGRP